MHTKQTVSEKEDKLPTAAEPGELKEQRQSRTNAWDDTKIGCRGGGGEGAGEGGEGGGGSSSAKYTITQGRIGKFLKVAWIPMLLLNIPVGLFGGQFLKQILLGTYKQIVQDLSFLPIPTWIVVLFAGLSVRSKCDVEAADFIWKKVSWASLIFPIIGIFGSLTAAIGSMFCWGMCDNGIIRYDSLYYGLGTFLPVFVSLGYIILVFNRLVSMSTGIAIQLVGKFTKFAQKLNPVTLEGKHVDAEVLTMWKSAKEDLAKLKTIFFAFINSLFILAIFMSIALTLGVLSTSSGDVLRVTKGIVLGLWLSFFGYLIWQILLCNRIFEKFRTSVIDLIFYPNQRSFEWHGLLSMIDEQKLGLTVCGILVTDKVLLGYCTIAMTATLSAFSPFISRMLASGFF